MEVLTLFVATLLATTAMTLFSYMASDSFRDLYKEPVLLQFVLSQLDLEMGKTATRITSWLTHYLIGLLFVIGYLIPVGLDWYEVSWLSGLVFGTVIGLIGILSWKLMFKMSGHTPIKHPPIYYIQLFFAHIIFALTTIVTYYSIHTL